MSAFKNEAELEKFAKRLTVFDLSAIFDVLGMTVQIGVVQKAKPPAKEPTK